MSRPFSFACCALRQVRWAALMNFCTQPARVLINQHYSQRTDKIVSWRSEINSYIS